MFWLFLLSKPFSYNGLPNGKSRFTMMPTKTSIKAVFTTSASNDGIYLLEAVIAANKANATTT